MYYNSFPTAPYLLQKVGCGLSNVRPGGFCACLRPCDIHDTLLESGLRGLPDWGKSGIEGSPDMPLGFLSYFDTSAGGWSLRSFVVSRLDGRPREPPHSFSFPNFPLAFGLCHDHLNQSTLFLLVSSEFSPPFMNANVLRIKPVLSNLFG